MKLIKYTGNDNWKELYEESLEELNEEINKLESEMLNDKIDENKILSIIDELKSIICYMEIGIDDGFKYNQ